MLQKQKHRLERVGRTVALQPFAETAFLAASYAKGFVQIDDITVFQQN